MVERCLSLKEPQPKARAFENAWLKIQLHCYAGYAPFALACPPPSCSVPGDWSLQTASPGLWMSLAHECVAGMGKQKKRGFRYFFLCSLLAWRLFLSVTVSLCDCRSAPVVQLSLICGLTPSTPGSFRLKDGQSFLPFLISRASGALACPLTLPSKGSPGHQSLGSTYSTFSGR